MRVTSRTAVLTALFSLIVIPLFVGSAMAGLSCSTANCYLDAVTSVPSSDATITVRLDNASYFTLPHTFTFANGTRHSIQVMNTTIRVQSTGVRYNWLQWTWKGNGYQYTADPMLHTPLMVTNYTGTNAFSADFTRMPPSGCISTCSLEAQTTVPTADGIVKVKVDGTTFYNLPHTFAFANGTLHTIQVLNTTLYAPSGARYVWKQWAYASQTWPGPTLQTPSMIYNYTTGASGPFIAQFDKQFQLTLTFTDASGQPVNSPNNVTLQNGSSIVTLNSTSYTSQWMSAGTWSVPEATWEGTLHSVLGTQTIDLTAGPVVTAVKLKAYPATILIVDRSNTPLPGVKVTVIFSNSTRSVFTTDSQGQVQLGRIPPGSYTTQVSYQNQDMGKWIADASQTPTNTIQLAVGNSTTASTTSAVVLLAIFGIAIFLVLLAVKLRRTPAPPTI